MLKICLLGINKIHLQRDKNMELISIPFAIAISLLWYLSGIRAQGKNKALKKSDYFIIVFLFGLVYSCLLIIITELLWDHFFGPIEPEDIGKQIIGSFYNQEN